MSLQRIKSLLVAAFSLISLFFATNTFAQTKEENGQQPEAKKMDAGKLIVEDVTDAHDFHLLTIKNDENPKETKHISIPLPVILYQKGKGFNIFSPRSCLEHLDTAYNHHIHSHYKN